MINGKYSEEEISNINEIEQLLSKDNQYVSVGQGSSIILQFVPERKITKKRKHIMDKQSTKFTSS